MNFTIPLSTPPGKYLLRIEHLYVRPWFNGTQFYVACAQVEIVQPQPQPQLEKLLRVIGRNRNGQDTKLPVIPKWRMPGEEYMVHFPGAYHLEDEGTLKKVFTCLLGTYVDRYLPWFEYTLDSNDACLVR